MEPLILFVTLLSQSPEPYTLSVYKTHDGVLYCVEQIGQCFAPTITYDGCVFDRTQDAGRITEEYNSDSAIKCKRVIEHWAQP